MRELILMTMQLPFFITTACLFGAYASAEVKVAKIFSDDMMLQRDQAVTVWGTATEDEDITVKIAGQSHQTRSQGGTWEVKLNPLAAGEKLTLEVQGKNTIVFRNIAVGDIWICGGQSNMDYDVSRYSSRTDKIGESYRHFISNSKSAPNVRLFLMKKAASLPDSTVIPVEQAAPFHGKWQVNAPEVVPKMSATGYVFAQLLHDHLKVPIGLIDANKGGSPIATWYAPETLKILNSSRPSMRNMYNAMIHTINRFPIKGAIWYQGESNARTVEAAVKYRPAFKAMIQGWRHDFNNPEMPFLFAQLAAYERNPYQHGITYPVIRDSQAAALELENTGMAVAIDLGEVTDIHPPHKIPLSERLVKAARKIAYKEELVHSGPLFKSLKIKGNTAVVSFNHVGSGLIAKEVTLGGKTIDATSVKGFEIAGADEVFHPASATIVGTEVEVSSPSVSKPVAVRYAYKGFPYANLYNQEGLPTGPFRTDNFTITFNQTYADAFAKRMVLPPRLASLKLGIEDKVKLVAIYNRHVSQELEAKLKASLLQVNKVGKAKGRKSEAYQAAQQNYKDLLKKAHAAIEKEAKAAQLIK